MLTDVTEVIISSYVGYTYRIEDGNLFIGVKDNLLFGFLDRNGCFDITVKNPPQGVCNNSKGRIFLYKKDIFFND